MREKLDKTDNELLDVQAQLTGAHARNDELTELNDQLYTELEARDVALGDAVRMIATYEDRVAELEQLLVQWQKDHRSGEDCEVTSFEGERAQGANASSSDERPKHQDLLSVGISPFNSRNSPKLATPFRPRVYRPDGTSISPCPSINNLIDLNTPLAASRSGSNFLKSAFLSTDTPLRSQLTSSHISFIHRCSSVVSESPGGLQTTTSPAQSSILDSPRLSELSDSSFASMYGDREGEPPEDSEDEGAEILSNDDEHPVLIGTPISSKGNRRSRGHKASETPSRRISPRRGMMDFIDKEREMLISNSVRNILPPTPESISPKRISGFTLIDNETSESFTPPTPISPVEDKGSEDSRTHSDSAEGLVQISLVTDMLELPPPQLHEGVANGPSQDPREELQVGGGNQKPSPQNGHAFAEITNVRKKPGFSHRIGRVDGIRKPAIRETITGAKYANTRIGGGGRKDYKPHSLPLVKGPPPPVKTNTPFNSLPPPNPNTPPYTPESDTTAVRSNRHYPTVTRKESWESINSSIEKTDNTYRRNSIAITTNLYASLRGKGNNELATGNERRKSSIPALVRSIPATDRNPRGVIGKGNREATRWGKN